jgi:two-component system, sensor histidine kinase and response regulator
MTTESTTRPGVSDGSNVPLSLPQLLDRCMGNAAVAKMILNKFEEQLLGDISKMQQQHSAGDASQLAKTAHALKGAAGAVAASALHDLSAEIEKMARENRLDTMATALSTLSSEVDRCLKHLPAVRNSL